MNYTKLARELKNYSYSRKGEIAKLTYNAAVAISTLQGRINVLEDKLKLSSKEKNYES